MLIYGHDNIEIWSVGSEYLVFGITIGGDPIACPSLGIAYEIAARAQ
jgi:hypothetical protein